MSIAKEIKLIFFLAPQYSIKTSNVYEGTDTLIAITDIMYRLVLSEIVHSQRRNYREQAYTL